MQTVKWNVEALGLLVVFLLLGGVASAEITVELSGEIRVPQAPAGIEAGDMDADGDLDLVTANEGGDSFSILRNRGSLGFTLGQNVQLDGDYIKPIAVELADLNEDGIMDVVLGLPEHLVYDEETYQPIFTQDPGIQVYMGQAGGGFSSVYYSLDGTPGSLDIYDQNNDGKLDIVAGNLGYINLGVNFQMQNTGLDFFVNQGNGQFGHFAHFESNGSISPIEFTDIDEDGDLDVIAVDQGALNVLAGNTFDDTNISIMRNDGQNNFYSIQRLNTETLPFSVATGDFNGDGEMDVIATEWGQTKLSFSLDLAGGSHLAGLHYWWNDGAENFNENQLDIIPGVPSIVKAADLDDDGDLDLIVTNEGVDLISGVLANPKVLLYENDGVGGFTEVAQLDTGREPRSAVVGDWDQDGDTDFAVVSQAASTVYIYKNVFSVPVESWSLH